MKITKAQKNFLNALKALNIRGETPNILQVAATMGNLSHGQTLYQYRVCNQLIAQELVHDTGAGRVHGLKITEEGLRAVDAKEKE